MSTFVFAVAKSGKSISHNFTRGFVLFGIIVAFLALSSTPADLTIYTCQSADTEQEAKDDQTENSKDVIKAFEAIPSSAQVHLDHQYLLIEVLPTLEEKEIKFPPLEKPESAGSKVLRILFRLIISPNAP